MARILVAEDEGPFRESVVESLRAAGHDAAGAATTGEALAAIRRDAFDLVLTDLRMPGGGGLEILREAAARAPDCRGVVMTAYGSLETAVDALRAGAQDFLVKPIKLEALARKVEQLLRQQALEAENRFLRGAGPRAADLVGASPEMEELRRLIQRVARTDSTVLVTGETGTGKELVARAVHEASPRAEAPFVAVNCGSIPEALLESELFGHVRGAFTGAERDKRGLFEVAGGGTLLLDEIGELPLPLQPKLLRALETREILRVGSTTPVRFGARIVAATHRDLRRMGEEGRFRPDLYFRLNVFEIPVAPLRRRRRDIRPIAEHLLAKLCGRMNRPVAALAPEALLALETYAWPGNVRELANVLERALILTDEPRLGLAELPVGLDAPPEAPAEDLRSARAAFERHHVRRVLEKYGGDKARAAAALGIDVSSVYRKLEEGA